MTLPNPNSTTPASPTAPAAPTAPTVPAAPALPALLAPRMRLTPSQVEGPYFIDGAPLQMRLYPASALAVVAPAKTPARFMFSGQVLAEDCTPIAGAEISVWLADVNGVYDNQDANGDPIDVAADKQVYRGRIIVDAAGNFAFDCLWPGNYFDTGWKLWRPAHVHVKVTAPGFTELTTQLYFDDDAHNSHDIPGDDFFLPELVLHLTPAIATTGRVQHGHYNFVLAKAA